MSDKYAQRAKEVAFDEALGDIGRSITDDIFNSLSDDAKGFLKRHKWKLKIGAVLLSSLIKTNNETEWSVKRRSRRVFTDLVDKA